MPIYEYHCGSCKKTFEVLQYRGEEESTLQCPSCEGTNLERILSPFSARSGKAAGAECSSSGST